MKVFQIIFYRRSEALEVAFPIQFLFCFMKGTPCLNLSLRNAMQKQVAVLGPSRPVLVSVGAVPGSLGLLAGEKICKLLQSFLGFV